MSLKTLFSRVLAATALGAAFLLMPVAQAQSSAAYAKVDPVQPSDTTGKIEVLEFFAYDCPHCAKIEPLIETWAKTLPDNVVLKRVPVAFRASQSDLQKLYYSLESLGRLDLHPAVFKTIHEENKPIFDQKKITQWVVDQGVDKAKFESVFNSFGVQTKVSRANELVTTYQIHGTPSIAIGGQYVTSPSMTGTYQGAIDEAQRLLKTLE